MGPEQVINYYAKSRVGARKIANAIGFLALLWSTVVLLGGFVGILRIKDFWFLSVLSVVMASKMLEQLHTYNAGIYMAEQDILHLTRGQDRLVEDNRWLTTFTLSAAIVMKQIFMVFIYLFFSVSLHVSIGLSVARLVQRDYGDAGGDATNKSKLNAALVIFYVLVIFHTLSVIYWGFLDTFEPWMLVSQKYGFEVWGPKIVRRYRAVTIYKCRKDGVLPNNWNLIALGVGLLESASGDDRLWGARVLDTFTRKGIPIRQELLSSSQAIQNLIDMIGLTRTDTEIRERAARIVADLASELRITKFPDVLGCICCLLDKNAHKVLVETLKPSHRQEDAHLSLAITKQADHKHLPSGELPKRKSWIQTMLYLLNKCHISDWDMYFGDKYHYSYVSKGTKELISQALVILERLTQDEENCTEIIRHQRLLSKITLPLSYHDFLSNGWDHTWVEILGRSLTVVSRLISAGPTDDATRLRRDMSCNAVAIRNLMCILEVDSECVRELHEQAIDILTELAFNDSFGKLAFDESTSMTEMFVKMLRHIFLEDRDGNAVVAKEDEEKHKRVRRKAGEALARLLRVPSGRENTGAFISAKNVNAVDLLPKQDIINLLTWVVNEVLSSKGEKAADVATLAGSSNSFHVEIVAESQPPNVADTNQPSTQEDEEQGEERKLLAAMLSLTVAIGNKNVIRGDDFTRAVPDNVALVKKLKEIVETNMDTTTGGWRILKLVCELVIAMAQLKPSCIRELNGHGFKQALSKALETMSDVDNCMMFAGNDREVPARSLTSLVKEALELLAQEQGDISV